MTNAIVLLSGGIDSAACALLLKDQKNYVRGLFVDYGQAASELEKLAAKKIAEWLQIDLHELCVKSHLQFSAGEIIGRNGLLVSGALTYGDLNTGVIALGVHAGTPYYDCSERFVTRINELVQEYTNGRISVIAPFLTWIKADVVRYCRDHDLPLGKTYSCERGHNPPCGECNSCRDRTALNC